MKKNVFLYTAALLPLAMTALTWTRLPEQIPTNWNVNGGIEYSSRWMLWLISGVALLTALALSVLPRMDPKKANYLKFEGAYWAICLATVLLLDAVMLIILTESLHPGTVNVPMVIQLMVAVLMLVIGNMMPKFRQTWFCGIKNPWTLSSERVWGRANRLGGYLCFAAGIIMLPGAFLPPRHGFALMLALVLTVTLAPLLMSYIWYRQEQSG